MDVPHLHRNSKILIGIGLVLVGLLGGIFGMLLLGDFQAGTAGSPEYARADDVVLGPRDPMRSVSVPADSAEALPTAAAVPSLAMLNTLFRDVASQVTPSVVYIQVEGAPAQDLFHQFDDDVHERFFRDMPRQSVGSGVIISEDGYVVTNHHVIAGATDIQVTLSDKRQFGAKVVGVDPSTDLAVLQVETDEMLPAAALGDSDRLGVGEWVLAVGNPFRLTSTVTAGIVSALGRQVDIIEDTFRIEDFIQTDAAINPGNSGGALVNMSGELVGINTAIATESGSYEGYGFAVPVRLMERVARDLIAYGEVHRGFLGVTIEPINARTAQELGLLEIGGVYIRDVRSDGPAYRAGMRNGDVVLTIDGRGVNAPNELQSAIARRRPGDRVAVEVWRDGQRQLVQVELMGRDAPVYQSWLSENQPEPAAPRPNFHREEPTEEVVQLGDWGLGLRQPTRWERDAFDVTGGVYVAYVAHGTRTARAGLPRDAIIVQIDDADVASVQEAVEALGRAAAVDGAVLFRVKRRDGLVDFYEVKTP